MLIGGHVSSSGGLARALERAEALGCEAMQIFNQSPRAWRPTRHKPDDIDAFKEARRTSPVAVVLIHAVYLINCASNDAEIRNKSLASLTHALCVGDAIEADGVVVHPGSAGKTVEAIIDIGFDPNMTGFQCEGLVYRADGSPAR